MDPISDMLASINNTQKNKKQFLTVPFSNVKLKIVAKLKQEQYIKDYKTEEHNGQRFLKIYLLYINGENRISHLKRISKPSLRRYVNHRQIPRILNGIGEIIISTPQGILTGNEARKKNLGGELICEVY